MFELNEPIYPPEGKFKKQELAKLLDNLEKLKKEKKKWVQILWFRNVNSKIEELKNEERGINLTEDEKQEALKLTLLRNPEFVQGLMNRQDDIISDYLKKYIDKK